MFFINLFKTNLKVKNIAKKIIYFTTTQSTNDDIWELYNKNQTENLIVITDYQQKGRGRLNNTWFSNPGKSIICSFLLNAIFEKEKFNLHAILIPVAIIIGVKKFLSINLNIKWPNDIIYNNKKVGGILIESKQQQQSYCFNIGIGINVNGYAQDFPESIKNSSITLQEIYDKPIQREPLLACILNELDNLIENLDSKKLIQLWNKSCCHFNKKVQFKYNDNIVKGIFYGITNTGQAIIKQNNNNIKYNGAIQIL